MTKLEMLELHGIRSSVLLVVLILLIIGPALMWRSCLNSSGSKINEPPEIKSKIPFFGHAIGILWYQGSYFERLSRRTTNPVFLVRILGARLYIITSPSIINATFARPQHFSFSPLMAWATQRILNFDDGVMHIITQSETGPNGRQPYVEQVQEILHATLAPGPALVQMNRLALKNISKHLNEIDTQMRPINLHMWIRDVLTEGTAAALYGGDNPFANDSSLIDSFWDFESSFIALLARVLPYLTARKGVAARSRLTAAFRSYFTSGKWKYGSGLVRARHKTGLDCGFTLNQIADCEVLLLFPALSNTVPTAFWLLSHILADEEFGGKVRREIEVVVGRKSRVESGEADERVEIDISKLRSSCPLLVAAWKENLRVVSAVTSTRVVTTDTLLKNQYLLKAESIILMAGAATHTAPDIWGSDSAVFNPRRFLPEPDSHNMASKTLLVEDSRFESRERTKLQNQAFFPFGGGKNLCPGRHFVFNEILGLVAMLLLAFEVEMADGGKFKVRNAARKKLGDGVVKPDGEMGVLVKRREEFKGVRLGFIMGESIRS